MIRGLSIFSIVIILCSSAYKSQSFHDPISILGRLKWNYTHYEENLWVREYTNRTLDEIYAAHESYFRSEFGETNLLKLEIVPMKHRIINAIVDVKKTWKLQAKLLDEKRYDEIRESAESVVLNTKVSMNSLLSATNQEFYFDYFVKKSLACKNVTSPHEPAVQTVFENYFIETTGALLKCYILLQLSYLTMASTNFVPNQKDARDLRSTFSSEFSMYAVHAEALAWRLSRAIWNCDSFQNASYIEITNFLQGYIDNEVNLNPDGSCQASCSDYKKTLNYDCREGTYCTLNYLDKQKSRCEGIVRDCGRIAWQMNICPNENDTITDRRYNYVKFAPEVTWGTEVFCPESVPVKGFYHWLAACNYCFCYCDVMGPASERHFSLREVTSNIQANKVVTGVRLMKTNGIIHWAIQERLFMPNGEVDDISESVKWQSNLHPIGTLLEVNHPEIFTLTYENRSITLNDVAGSNDEVVTGVRFVRAANGNLQLEVRFTYYDRLTGKLDTLSESVWMANNYAEPKKITSTSFGDVPTAFPEQSIMNRDGGTQSIEFGPANVEKNLAQNTVPFIETTPVEPYEPAALSAIGLYLKSQPGSGGVIAPKVVVLETGKLPLHIRASIGVYGM